MPTLSSPGYKGLLTGQVIGLDRRLDLIFTKESLWYSVCTSFTRASEVSQPHIRQLEEEFQSCLLVRLTTKSS